MTSKIAEVEERRFMAVVLPELLNELATREPCLGKPPHPRSGMSRGTPRAVVLSEVHSSMLEPNARLGAVNSAARALGVSTRSTIAQATALVENLTLCALPPARVVQALKQVAEAALAFGSPVSFQSPDTVWVEVSGTRQLFGGERELALALTAHVRSLGHTARVAGASGPWLAQSFARHADFDETGVYLVGASQSESRAGLLPIGALPVPSDVVAWFARLGLLSLDDLRALPAAMLASRLETKGVERIIELIRGRDDGVLDAYVPEELPFEEQGWDFPLESVEPLLFVLKGLCARLGSRLEGRGQAAQELLLTVEYDKPIAALRRNERDRAPDERQIPCGDCLEIPFKLASPLAHAEALERIVRSRLQRETLFAPAIALRLRITAITESHQWQQSLNVEGGLGSTLSNDPRTLAVLIAELSADLGVEAVGRLEAHDSHLLEKSSCFVPIRHLADERRADYRESRFESEARTPEPAPGSTELSGGGGPEGVVADNAGGSSRDSNSRDSSSRDSNSRDSNSRDSALSNRLPTRLIAPIEFKAPLKEKEILVLDQRAFVIEAIQFEERLEAVEWWAPSPISRDYFRLWLSSLSTSSVSSASGAASAISAATTSASAAARSVGASGRSSAPASAGRFAAARGEGLEVLVYLNRDDGKRYVQALYD
jgi:protein ImuB